MTIFGHRHWTWTAELAPIEAVRKKMEYTEQALTNFLPIDIYRTANMSSKGAKLLWQLQNG